MEDVDFPSAVVFPVVGEGDDLATLEDRRDKDRGHARISTWDGRGIEEVFEVVRDKILVDLVPSIGPRDQA